MKLKLLFIMFLDILAADSFSQSQVISNSEIANLVEKISMFVSWPTPYAQSKTFNIGIIGTTDDFSFFVKHFENRKIKSVPVKVYLVSKTDYLIRYRLIIILENSSSPDPISLESVIHSPVLTVSVKQERGSGHAHIFLNKANEKTKFFINQSAILNSGLQVSYILYNEAQVIEKVNDKP